MTDFHIYVHMVNEPERATLDKLDHIIALLAGIRRQEQIIMADLTEITAKVQATQDAEQSAIVLLQGLKGLLDAAGTDPVKLKALSDQLGTGADALAAAVVANTPTTP